MLFAHGCRFGGNTLYIKDGRLKYDYNYVGEFDQYVESSKPVPAGDCRLSASFEKSGTGMPTEGLLSLYVGRPRKGGQGRVRTRLTRNSEGRGQRPRPEGTKVRS